MNHCNPIPSTGQESAAWGSCGAAPAGMASSGGEFGAGGKRHRQQSGTEDGGGDASGRGKRRGVSLCPRSGGIDDGESGGGGSDVSGYDGVYLYDDDDDDEAAEQTRDDAASSPSSPSSPAARGAEGPRYVVLTEADLRGRQEADTARVAEVLAVPPGLAAVLLRHARWRVGRAQEDWFSDEPRARAAVGLPAEEGGGAALGAALERSPGPRVCAVCFDAYPAGRTRSAACRAHFYCDGCWRGYVRAAVGDGAACLALRCPDPACPAPVLRELVDEVLAADADRARYARFWLRSYVEESGGRIKWCPAPGCARAVERLGGCAGDEAATADAFCACGHGFCWLCGEEAHRPVPCGMVRAWLAKNSSESETANWVLANAKHCPKCRRPIEKNHGCNHMTCSAPCRQQFCWLCLDPWDNHRGCSRYNPRRQRQRWQVDDGKKSTAVGLEEAARREQAKASLDRYLYHYERWAANGKSLQKALADMDQLERSELERMAAAVDLPTTELGFMTEAYRQIAHGRRVLRWAHAYGYFLDPERDAAKRGLFDDLQGQANRWLECLHACAELERKELFRADNGEPAVVPAETFRAYREKVANLTGVTRKFLSNLVKAFETDLPEVVKPSLVPQIVNGPTMGRQTVGSGGIISTETAEVAPVGAIQQMVSAPSFSLHIYSQGKSTLQASPSSSPISQEANVGATPLQVQISNMMEQSTDIGFFGSNTYLVLDNSDVAASSSQHNSMGMGQSVKHVPQGLMTCLQLGQGRIDANQNVMRGLGPTTISSGPAMMPTLGIAQQTVVNPFSVTNNSARHVSTGQDPNVQQPPPKYVRLWEGTLSGIRQGQRVFICRLEGYRSGTASELLAVHWPGNMQIVRLIAQEHMNNKQYVGNADFLIFRTLNQHGFLQQLQEKHLCAVIQLPSQTLLLSMSEKAGRMIGVLLPGDMVVFKFKQHELLQVQQQHMPMQPQGLALQEQPHSQMQPREPQQEPSPKYVKFWEGTLNGRRQGQPVFICKLEGFRNTTMSEILAVDWPINLHIVRLMDLEYMKRQYVGGVDFLLFRMLNQHGFLQQIQDRNLGAVIQLPSQTLVLSMSEKAGRMIAYLYHGDVVFKPQVSDQQATMQQQHHYMHIQPNGAPLPQQSQQPQVESIEQQHPQLEPSPEQPPEMQPM